MMTPRPTSALTATFSGRGSWSWIWCLARPEIIRMDYGMTDGSIQMRVRCAVADYMLLHWSVDPPQHTRQAQARLAVSALDERHRCPLQAVRIRTGRPRPARHQSQDPANHYHAGLHPGRAAGVTSKGRFMRPLLFGCQFNAKSLLQQSFMPEGLASDTTAILRRSSSTTVTTKSSLAAAASFAFEARKRPAHRITQSQSPKSQYPDSHQNPTFPRRLVTNLLISPSMTNTHAAILASDLQYKSMFNTSAQYHFPLSITMRYDLRKLLIRGRRCIRFP